MAESAGDDKKHQSGFKSCLSRTLKRCFERQIDKIHDCIKRDDIERLRYLHMVKKLNFNKYTSAGDSPLLLAARYQKLDILKYILTKVQGVIKGDKSFTGDTALMIATFNDDLEMVKYLVEEQGFDVNCRDNKGYTPFIAACANNYMDLVVYYRFIAKADTGIRGFDKQSAVHRAAFYGNIEVLLVLENYTTLRNNQPDKWGNLPIHYAAMNNNFSVVR